MADSRLRFVNLGSAPPPFSAVFEWAVLGLRRRAEIGAPASRVGGGFVIEGGAAWLGDRSKVEGGRGGVE